MRRRVEETSRAKNLARVVKRPMLRMKARRTLNGAYAASGELISYGPPLISSR